MTALLQISDPHFGTERSSVVEALRRLVKELAPDVVVLTGDVTQRATPAQFEAAARFFASLPCPVRLAIPGNHDIPLINLPLRLAAPFTRFQRAFGVDLEPVYDGPSLQLTCLNTVVPYWHKDGAVRPATIERVAKRLASAGEVQLRVVVCHHPVLAIRQQDEGNLLHGSDDAIRRWVAAGADLIVGGHIHLPYLRPLRQRFPDLPREAWAVQAGTAVSTRVRDGMPNSVNLIRCEARRGSLACTIERWDFDATAHRFGRAGIERLTPDRAGAESRAPAHTPR